jgi:hypothetical protein
MPKDPLLAEKFFSPSRSESQTLLEQQEQLAELVKQKLYLHLSSEQSPTYYQGPRTLSELNKFIYIAYRFSLKN